MGLFIPNLIDLISSDQEFLGKCITDINRKLFPIPENSQEAKFLRKSSLVKEISHFKLKIVTLGKDNKK